MLIAFTHVDGRTAFIKAEATEETYYHAGDVHAGYGVPEASDFLPDDDSEYFGFSVISALYEAGQATGSFGTWAFAWMPENDEETYHLRRFATCAPCYM